MKFIELFFMGLLLFLAFNAEGQKGGPITKKIYDQKLIGTWVSECLTPNPRDPWSEKHTFVFQKDGTAIHTKTNWDKAGCTGFLMNVVNNYKYVIGNDDPTDPVGGGFIDLLGPQGNIYDIYLVTGNSLLFGHGFRNKRGTEAGGTSPAARIRSFNKYIIYKKLGGLK